MAEIKVQLKGSSQEISSPSLDREEAERQLAAIRAAIESGGVPDVPWLAAAGNNILAASIFEWES